MEGVAAEAREAGVRQRDRRVSLGTHGPTSARGAGAQRPPMGGARPRGGLEGGNLRWRARAIGSRRWRAKPPASLKGGGSYIARTAAMATPCPRRRRSKQAS